MWRLLRQAMATGERAGKYSTHIDKNCKICGVLKQMPNSSSIVYLLELFGFQVLLRLESMTFLTARKGYRCSCLLYCPLPLHQLASDKSSSPCGTPRRHEMTTDSITKLVHMYTSQQKQCSKTNGLLKLHTAQHNILTP